MMKSKFLIAFLWVAFCVPSLQPVFSQDGHGHSHDEEEKSSASESNSYFSIEASSDKYELVLRYEPIHPGEKASLTLFASEYATNKPLDKAEIGISAQEDSKLKFTLHQESPGVYHVEGNFPEAKMYSLVANIKGSLGADLLLIGKVEPGKELPHEDESVSEGLFKNWKTWVLIGFSLLIGLCLGLLMQRRNSARGKAIISLILLSIAATWPVSSSLAHGDEPHGAKQTTNNYSNQFSIPKETQFLFEVFTEVAARTSFVEGTSLSATIIPSSDGQAVVSSSQNGKIVSLAVKVGQIVRKGQLLAVVERNLDAGSQLSQAAEKNNLLSEVEVSKKEYERLLGLHDIIAKKDLEAAKGRFQRAEANLSLLNSNTAKNISLVAPISGMVGNFTLTLGSTVNSEQELFKIINLDYVYAEAQVFDKDAPKVAQGSRFTVECSNDNHKVSEVQLLSLAQEVNQSNQSQRILFSLHNKDHDFKIGEYVNIRVFSSDSSRQISVPNSAISEINGKPVVFIKKSGESFGVSYILEGQGNGSFTTIQKGLDEGDRVVVNGAYQLKMIYLNQ
jgi:membrane fusion protein, heavy metal efflux system